MWLRFRWWKKGSDKRSCDGSLQILQHAFCSISDVLSSLWCAKDSVNLSAENTLEYWRDFQMNNHKFLLSAIFLFVFLSALVLPVFALSYNPGVTVGQFIKYGNFSGNGQGFEASTITVSYNSKSLVFQANKWPCFQQVNSKMEPLYPVTAQQRFGTSKQEQKMEPQALKDQS